MQQMTLDLKPFDSRPIVKLKNFFGIDALLDTGAVIPVWTDDEDILQSFGGVKVRENAMFGGFGGKAVGNLYHIPTFTVGGLTFPNLPVVAARMNLPCYMILSATMFSRLIYEVNDFHHKLNITIPNGEPTVRVIKDCVVNGRLKIVLAND